MTTSTGSAGRASRTTHAPVSRRRGAGGAATIAIPALLAYVPLLFTEPGWVGADTKTYLYLDPWKLMSGAPYVWDEQIGLGTVTHQNIGYLFPMGPFYLFFDAIGVPDWIAQRLWLGTVLFAAAMGVRYLLGALGQRGPGRDGDARMGDGGVLVASLAYMLSPYLLDYSARISVILLPWAALGWLIALTAQSLRHGGWRYPAWFAFTVLLVGGINATALIMVGLGPILWVAHAVWVDREVRARQALASLCRIGALTLATSLWWIAGLWAEGRYGLPVIRYTESYRTVAEVSNAPEVLRGLGYWFFYGNDKLGPWIEPSIEYTTRTPLLALSFALPIAAFAIAALLRWRTRAYFIALIVFGALAAVASHPWKAPSLLGIVFKEFTRTDAGLSLRSTPRAVPLVVLGSAVFLGAGVSALGRLRPRWATPVTVVACLLVVANIPPMFNGTMIADNLKRPEEIPGYWLDDARFLDSRGSDTRVLELPGADFASYRWGNTVDPVLPGLMARPVVARELFTWGSPPSANLINALDRRFHEEAIDPAAIAPVARLMGAGDINIRSDMQYERYRVARPRTLWQLMRRTPGLGPPVEFGPPTPNVAGPQQTLIDEIELATPLDLPDAPPVAAFPVLDPLPIVRTASADRPLLLAADGEGIVDAASVGLIDPRQALFYSASFARAPEGFARVYTPGADLMLTDTNRKRARRWGALRENTGYTERAGEVPLAFDPTDQRLDVFPGAGDDAYSVSEQRRRDGSRLGATVTATGYGNPITFTPDDRPAHALDGDPLTAWRVGAIADVQNEKVFVDLAEPVTTDTVNLLQPINLERTRWITRGRIVFDDDTDHAVEVDLDDRSRAETGEGQDVTFGTRTFRRFTFEVLETNLGPRPLFDGVSGVGFAEIRLPGVGIEDLVRMPTDLLDLAGPSSRDHRLALLFTRLRSNPAEPVRTDEETAMRRIFSLPTGRSFAYAGQARVSAYLRDDQIDRMLGMPDSAHGGVTARADVHLPGNLRQRASAAIDGDPSTSWTSIYQKQDGHWIEYEVPRALSFDRIDLEVVADGRHSVPTRLHLDADGVTVAHLDVPAIADQPALGGTVRVTLPLGRTITASTLRLTIDDVRKVAVQEWYSSGDTVTPVAIAELGIPGLHLDKAAPTFDSGCRTDLLSVDGRPFGLRVRGTTDEALDRGALAADACGTGAGPVELDAGEHVLRSGIGRDVGIDLDRLVLASDAGGGALAVDRLPSDVGAGPITTVTSDGRIDASGEITPTDRPYWLVMGQSWNPGWAASANGVDLGAPTLFGGYANAWLVDPAKVGSGPVTFSIAWKPQTIVWITLATSVLACIVCVALMLAGRRAPRGTAPSTDTVMPDPARPALPVFALPNAPTTVARGARPTVVAALAFGAFVAVDVPTQWAFPLLGVPAALALAWSLRSPRGRSVLGLAGSACFALAAAYVLVQQRRHRYNPNFVWPTLFSRVHILGLLAIFLLGAEAVRELLTGPPDDEPATDPDARPADPPADPPAAPQ